MSTKDVKLPDIGEGVTEGEMVKWLVKVGDTVKADQPIAEVMTDKATVEVPTPFPGVVKELKVKEGDVVPIESVLLVLDSSGGAAASAPAKSASAPAPAAQAAAAKSSHAPAASAAPTAISAASSSATSSAESRGTSGGVYPPAAAIHVLATPATRRFARETNVDINQLRGSGVAGRVTLDDVKNATGGAQALSKAGIGATAAGAPTFAAIPKGSYTSNNASDERVPLRGIRRKIAEQMQMTKQVVPHFTIMDEANVSELVRVRSQAKEVGEKYGVKVTYLPFVMKALVATMREFPMFNASIDDQAGEIVYKKHYNIGFAADTPNGLLVPVIKNADQKNILEISKEINDLAKKARDGKIAGEDMKGATITITNIGSVGGTYATPIINHPEVAIIGMYKVDWKPVYKDGQFVPTQVMNYTATCDHRLIDGAVAANFLKAFLSRIENPSRLMLEMI
jgi:pyruvate dehydrogenase E2 component (dihydrolipoamide acetyltransferase)